MSTTTTVITNQVLNNVTNQSITPINVGSVDEITLSISCDASTPGTWFLSRLDAFNVPVLFQEGPLFHGDWPQSIGPSASYDITNGLGDALQLDFRGASGNVNITVSIIGKAYS